MSADIGTMLLKTLQAAIILANVTDNKTIKQTSLITIQLYFSH